MHLIKTIKIIFSMFFLAVALFSCKFFELSTDKETETQKEVTNVKLSTTLLNLKAGEMSYLGYSIMPSSIKVTPTWKYDDKIISITENTSGVVITGLSEGQTYLTITAGNYSSTCIITVTGYSDYYSASPYIYSSTSIMQLQTGDTETVTVSLYNGTASDITNYTWTIDDSSIATLEPTGQYCSITSLKQGYTRIKVTNSASTYPYYIGLYVFNNLAQEAFITTSKNIVLMNLTDAEQEISVSLKNSKTNTSDFTWSVSEGSECLSIVSNKEKCVITPLAAGTATIRITHPEAKYPLDITVRVIAIVKNVYIEPSTTLAEIKGENQITITSNLVGLKEGSEYSVDDFEYSFEGNDSIVTYYSSGKNIYISGLKNGSTSLYITHPAAAKSRQVLTIVSGCKTDATDSSIYITTSQNYIKTKIGAEDSTLSILLKGGSAGDEKDFIWTVKQQPEQGTANVISLKTATGSTANARSANTFASGIATITPLAIGTATITLSHPKAYYSTEILIKVLDKNAILEEPLYFIGDNIVKFLNSDTYNYNVLLKGNNLVSGNEQNIVWSTDSSTLSLIANADNAVLSSTGSGNCMSTMKIEHSKVENEKKVLVLTADTQTELDAMQAFYADKYYYSVNASSTCSLFINTVGFDETADFSSISWISSSPNVATVEKDSSSPLTGIVSGLTAGKTTIKASYKNLSIEFTVTVYPQNVDIGKIETTSYLTTSSNVININSVGTQKKISVNAINITEASLQDMNWESSNPSIASVLGNGTTAIVTAVAEGEAIITVSHELSENELKLHVLVGSEYIDTSEPTVYISTNTDIISLTKDASLFSLTAKLINAKNNEGLSGFSFEIDDTSIASISAQYATGTCYIKPCAAGQAEITISHASSAFKKKVLVVIGNTKEELSAFKYLSTGTNVVTIAEGSTATISATVLNSPSTIINGYSWKSQDISIASISTSSSSTCVVQGNTVGTTLIQVSNTECTYPLDIIVQVVDANVAESYPYITTNTNIITLIESSTSWTSITADLAGGKTSDYANFEWSVSDSSILQAYGQNEIGKVRAVGTGIAYIYVKHPKAAYSQQILCICESAQSTDYSISVSTGNIISIKPTAADKTITASLVNGTTADRNNFTWSLDVYDIIDLSYSANTAVISPLSEGQCTLTVSHPKSAYDQKIIIKVQSYDNFGFSSSNKTIVEGTSSFISIQKPVSSVETHVEYSTANDSICTISGTSAVCQLTGIGSGTTTVTAKLVATKTATVQATAEMLVYVQKASSTDSFITATSTVYTMELGTNKTVSANLKGNNIDATDLYNLKWISSDPNIIKIYGASTTGVATGSQVYVEALSAGECTVTISHDKCNSDLVYYFIVPGNNEPTVSLNKTYVSVQTLNNIELKATITDGSNTDYENLSWTATKTDGAEIVRILGNGKTVSLYGITAGTSTVTATLPNGHFANCTVVVTEPNTLKFDRTTVSIQPVHKKTIEYTIAPSNADITWAYSGATDGSDYFSFVDNGNTGGKGSLTIEGIKEGSGTLAAVSNYGNTARLNVTIAWDYSLTVSSKNIAGTPDDEFTVNYKVNPAEATIKLTDSSLANISVYDNGDGTGYLNIIPKKEGSETISLSATNPSNHDEIGFCDIKMSFYYNSMTSVPEILTKDGNFSYYDTETGIFHLGDGEAVNLNLAIKETKADYTISSWKFAATSGNTRSISTQNITIGEKDYYQVSDGTDNMTYEYYISNASHPTWFGSEIALWDSPAVLKWNAHLQSNGGDIGIECYTINTEQTHNYLLWWDDDDDDYWSGTENPHRISIGYGSAPDNKYTGVTLSESAFKNIAWFYCPGYYDIGKSNNHSTVAEHIRTQYVTATRKSISDTSVISSTYIGNLSFVVTYKKTTGMQNQTVTVPVYIDVRNCSKTE